MREVSARWSRQDVDDLSQFGGSTSNLINRMLRNPKQGLRAIREQTPHLTAWMDRVDNLLRNAPRAAEPRTLFRGLSAPEHVRTEADFRRWVEESFGGDRFDNPGYTSTTMDPEMAANFAHSGGAKFGVVVEIRSPQGLPMGKVLHDRAVPDELHEGEYALPRGFNGKVVGVSDGVPFERAGTQERFVVVHVVDDSLPGGTPGPAHQPHQPDQPQYGNQAGQPNQPQHGNQAGAPEHTNQSEFGPVRERNAEYPARPAEHDEFITSEPQKVVDAYRRIRSSTDDVPKVAEAAGLDPALVEVAKRNVFVNVHDVALGPADIRRGNFSPLGQIADRWQAAMDGHAMAPSEVNELRSLIAHEYVEAKLIEDGVPYNFADPKLWDDGYYDFSREHAGAHQVAPWSLQPGGGTDLLKHWPKLGLTPPPGGLAPDMSNLDDVIRIAKEGMGW